MRHYFYSEEFRSSVVSSNINSALPQPSRFKIRCSGVEHIYNLSYTNPSEVPVNSILVLSSDPSQVSIAQEFYD